MAMRRRWRAWGFLGLLALTANIAGPAQGSIPEGPPVWAARYNGPPSSYDMAWSQALSSDGSKVFATGESIGTGSSPDYATAAYDASSGAQLWVARYDGPANSEDAARSVAVSPDGSAVFVTGYSRGTDSSDDYATVAYSASNGAQLWVARYNGPANYGDRAYSLAVSPGGTTVFVTGYSWGTDSATDYATVAYSVTSGAQLWVARHDGPVNSLDGAGSLAVSRNGTTVFVTGYDRGTDYSSDYATVAYSASSGAQLWVARYNGSAHSDDYTSGVVVSPDDSMIFVTGNSVGTGSSADYATVAYSAATGAQLWVARYNGPGNSYDVAWSLAVSPDGSKVFVVGESDLGGFSYDYATVAYSASSGSQLWVARYDGPANSGDGAHSVAVGPDGSTVFVTGYSLGADSSNDYATVAYSASSGAQLWVARYNGPANSDDGARSVAVSPDGSKFFVTGYSYGGAGNSFDYDYATLAYRATSCVSETGPVSGKVHGTIESQSGPAAPYVHAVNCDVVAPAGL